LERARNADSSFILEPKVSHAAPFRRKILEGVETIEMIYGEVLNKFRVGMADVDCHSAAAHPICLQTSLSHYTRARRAKQYFELRIFRVGASVGSNGTFDRNPLALIVIGPKPAVAPTQRAIACGDRSRMTRERPSGFAAMT
jgi:hypothetical protein